jgi:diguanylate cyclase (GGDEF)-like protein
VDASLFFTGTLFVVTLLGGLGLRNLLRPLVNLEEQAMALADRQFHIQDELPRTRELRRIVSAMNRASERLRDMFHEQTALADSLMQQAYQDPLTALGNRRFLEAQILAKVTSKLNKLEGAFLLVQIQGVHQMNQRQGYESGDQLIKQTAQIIKQVLAETGEPIIARLAGGDFAILLLNISPNKAKQIGANILELHSLTETSREQRLTCGGVTFQSSTTSQSLLSAADQALASARYQDKASPTIIPLDDHTLLKSEGSHARKSALEAILTNRAITLYYQPTVQHDNLADIFHIEILTRMTDSAGSHLSIGSIIPIAEQFRMMPLLDRLILETIFAIPKNHLQPPRIAVNVSPLSLEDPEFFSWLVSQLNECSTMGITLFFEFPEFKAIRHQRIINLFASQIKELGHGIGIDHFGQGLIHFGYLNSVLPHYVKIDRAITQDLWNKHSDSSFFVNALCTVAHSLDIRVIVEGVETEAQWQAISGMHVDAVQGFFVQRPKPLSLAEKQPNG